MASNWDKIKEKYQNAEEEKRASLSRYASLEFEYTIKHVSEYIKKNTAVIELGCGTGYYAMHFYNKCKEYIGIDIVPANIDLFHKKIKDNNIKNVKALVGDATHLSEISDQSFDVVLCFGPMYHLPPEERELVFSECSRICKYGGIAAFAYINKIGVYAGGCLHDQFKRYYPNEKANQFILRLNRDDVNPDLFFFTMPEEMEKSAKRHGFSKMKNLGTDFFITMSIVNAMSNKKFEWMKPLLDQMTEYESCTGMSNHAILVCQKTVND